MSEKKVRIPLKRYEWPDEKKQKRNRIVQVGILIISILLSVGFGYSLRSAFIDEIVVPVQQASKLNRVEAIFDVLTEEWYFGRDQVDLETQLIEDAIKGMIDGTGDIHTSYMNSEEVTAFTEAINRNFVGIGVSYFDNNGTFIIERVFIGSPAEKAGVLPGDIIKTVDGVSTQGLTSDDLVDRVRGIENTVVTIDFQRGEEVVTLEITRGVIKNTAFGKMIDEDTAYLEIYQFGEDTGSEVEQYMQLFKENNAKDIIIDLRDNGGGYLTTLEDIGSMFIPKDGILIQQEIYSGEKLVSKSRGNIIVDFEEIILLVNENSASASEVLTAAIKENIEATIIGVTTYGKGTVQQQHAFSDGSALKYTVAEWLTPNGNHINGVGINPDIVVDLHPVMHEIFTELTEEEAYGVDTVDDSVQDAQLALDFLGYNVDRTDGYFSTQTLSALEAYIRDYKLEDEPIINKQLLDKLRSEVVRIWNVEKSEKDVQLKKALELIND
jgi:carboxyl-terminal processing protease